MLQSSDELTSNYRGRPVLTDPILTWTFPRVTLNQAFFLRFLIKYFTKISTRELIDKVDQI